ncbi:hypothetical protein D3C84_605000 [compost metagenome]
MILDVALRTCCRSILGDASGAVGAFVPANADVVAAAQAMLSAKRSVLKLMNSVSSWYLKASFLLNAFKTDSGLNDIFRYNRANQFFVSRTERGGGDSSIQPLPSI